LAAIKTSVMGISSSDVSRATGIDGAKVYRCAKVLQERGLVKREEDHGLWVPVVSD